MKAKRIPTYTTQQYRAKHRQISMSQHCRPCLPRACQTHSSCPWKVGKSSRENDFWTAPAQTDADVEERQAAPRAIQWARPSADTHATTANSHTSFPLGRRRQGWAPSRPSRPHRMALAGCLQSMHFPNQNQRIYRILSVLKSRTSPTAQQ